MTALGPDRDLLHAEAAYPFTARMSPFAGCGHIGGVYAETHHGPPNGQGGGAYLERTNARESQPLTMYDVRLT
jgi:hypothetical protein